MHGRAYFNEIDLEACGALRELMALGLIARGDIDNRSIKDVTADDLKGYTQVHLCAGIGVWSYAARIAGWPDNRELWTGSFPCQPISNAGKRLGASDPRHLWPDGFRLIRARRPAVVMGEQVAGSLGYNWFDGVQSDLEGEDFACRTVDIPACSIDAPHIRNRLAWIAKRSAAGDGDGSGWRGARLSAGRQNREGGADTSGTDGRDTRAPGDASDVGHSAVIGRREGGAETVLHRRRPTAPGTDVREHGVALGDTEGVRGGAGLCEGRTLFHRHEFADADGSLGVTLGDAERSRLEGFDRHGDGSWRSQPHRPIASPDGRNGTFWSDAEWLICHDQKARRSKPGVRLLVDGSPKRISRWRVAGNAICAPFFVEVIAAYLESEG